MENFVNNDGGLKNNTSSPHRLWLSSREIFDKLKTIGRNGEFYFGYGVKVYRNFETYTLEINGNIADYGRGNYIAHLVRLVFWIIDKYGEEYK